MRLITFAGLLVIVTACPGPSPRSAPPATPSIDAGLPRATSRVVAREEEPPAVPATAEGAVEPLEAEEREANPTSEKVRIRLWAAPVEATVFWGAKKLGLAGKTPLEIERPRASGPLELVARAPGYLPFHTRVLTDRDEKLTLRLVRNEDAPALLGWKRAAPTPAR